MMKSLVRERYAGLAATGALIVGLISVSSAIVEIGVANFAVAYGDRLPQRVHGQPDASPIAATVNRDQRGLILYFFMEAARVQPR